MNINEKEAVQAAQAAFIDLLELAEQGAQGDSSVDSEGLREEAQLTMLMLIAAVMLADGQYEEGEQEFIRLLVDARDKPGGEVGYLNDYAARWAKASMDVPGFYCAAVRRDSRDGTDIAWQMRCRIQLIGNYASSADGKFVASERETVRRYVAFLEDYADAWRLQTPVEGAVAFAGSDLAGVVDTGAMDGSPPGDVVNVTGEPNLVSGPVVGCPPDAATDAGRTESGGPKGWGSIG